MPTLGPFIGGMCNKADVFRLPSGPEGQARTVAAAVDVDVSSQGTFRTRPTPQRILSGVGFRDGFSCKSGMVFRRGSQICRFDGQEAVVLTENITGSKISWAYFFGIIYFSDGVKSKKILPDWTVRNWGIVPPASAPVLAGSGRYGAGQYQACMTFVDMDGVESGPSPISTANGGSRATGLRVSSDRQVVSKRIYVTEPNGSTFFMAAEVANGATEAAIPAGYRSGLVIATMGRRNPPAGHIVRAAFGRLFIASGNTIWYTDEFSPDLLSMGKSAGNEDRYQFWQLPEKILVMEPVEGGIWVVSDKTYYIAGRNPNEAEIVERSRLSAVEGTGLIDEESGNAQWMTPDGLAIGSPGGELTIPSSSLVAPDTALSGCSVIMDKQGFRQNLTVLHNPARNRMAVGSFMVAEVV